MKTDSISNGNELKVISMNFLAVGIGGILGSLVRYFLGIALSGCWGSIFPYGTLAINLAGSLGLSFIVYGSLLKWQLPRPYLLAVTTGFMGSFTTFSTFSGELLSLLKQEQAGLALVYILVSLVAGLTLSWLGIYLAMKLYSRDETAKEQGA